MKELHYKTKTSTSEVPKREVPRILFDPIADSGLESLFVSLCCLLCDQNQGTIRVISAVRVRVRSELGLPYDET